jgi:hypothetical protein
MRALVCTEAGVGLPLEMRLVHLLSVFPPVYFNYCPPANAITSSSVAPRSRKDTSTV